MATSSFNKNFVLDNKESIDVLTKMINNPIDSVKIDKKLISTDQVKRGEAKLKKILSR